VESSFNIICPLENWFSADSDNKSLARLVFPVDQESGEADELVLVAVQERVAIAPPLHPHLVADLEGGDERRRGRIPVVLRSGVPLVVVDHACGGKRFQCGLSGSAHPLNRRRKYQEH